MMDRGNLKAFGKNDAFLHVEPDGHPGESLGIQVLYCMSCGHAELRMR